MAKNNRFISTAELAKILGISRVAVFNRIKNGRIKAMKVGRSFVVAEKELGRITGRALSTEAKKEIGEAVKKTVAEYGQTLRLLGQN